MITPRTRAIVGVLALAALVGTLAACQVVPSYDGPTGGPRVAVVGDSLVHGLEGQLADALHAAGWRAYVRGEPGDTIADALGPLADVAATSPQVMVIALGTNEVGAMAEGHQTLEGTRADVRQALASTASPGCLVWVGVNDSHGEILDWQLSEWGPRVNQIITEELAASGRPAGAVVYADWAAASRGHPEYFNGPKNVHFTEAGNAAHTALILDAVAQCDGNPIRGTLDTATSAPGAVQTTGWAFDPDAGQGPIDVHVYVAAVDSGALLAMVPTTANQARPDVGAAFPGRGDQHGFDTTVGVATGRYLVAVFGIDTGAGSGNQLLGLRSATVG